MDTAYLLGYIQLFPYNFAPLGWLLCNGDVLQVASNRPLFYLLGTQFGGDGTKTFALPNLENTSPVEGMAYYIATAGIYPSHSE